MRAPPGRGGKRGFSWVAWGGGISFRDGVDIVGEALSSLRLSISRFHAPATETTGKRGQRVMCCKVTFRRSRSQ